MRFDIETWEDKGLYGRRRLLRARLTPVMACALLIRGPRMCAAGITHDTAGYCACWIEPDRDEAKIHAILVEAELAARVFSKARDNEAIERRDRERREEEELRTDAQRALKTMIEARPWLSERRKFVLFASTCASLPAKARSSTGDREVNGLDRADLLTSLRALLDGKTLRASEEIAGEILDGLVAGGWTVTRAPEPPLRRLVLTVIPDKTPVETVELSRT